MAARQVCSSSGQGQRKQLRVLSEDKKREIKEAFEVFDSDRDGYLDYLELKASMRALGFSVKKEDVMKIMKTYDRKHQKRIGFEDFYDVMTDMMIRQDPIEDMKRAFKLFSSRQSDGITFSDLRRVAVEIGEDVTDEELMDMIVQFDCDGDGKVNEEEFMKIMCQTEDDWW